MTNQPTVQDVTYDLLRTLGLTTIFGNPGSTEETFLKNFPDDFTYVLGLQEASVMAMADGFAQSTGKPALVNLHTSAVSGNAIGSLPTRALLNDNAFAMPCLASRSFCPTGTLLPGSAAKP